jgi:hypothetical protein
VLGYFQTSAARTKQPDPRRRRMFMMSNKNAEIDNLRQKLRALDAEFDREMRARGFDPAQTENVALPSHLAAVYAEREQIKAELAELIREETND